jgi:hypothetical protein
MGIGNQVFADKNNNGIFDNTGAQPEQRWHLQSRHRPASDHFARCTANCNDQCSGHLRFCPSSTWKLFCCDALIAVCHRSSCGWICRKLDDSLGFDQ